MTGVGIVVIGEGDKVIQGRAKAARIPLQYTDTPCIPFAKTLIVESGTKVPFAMLEPAWHFLERWDAAIPLYRYTFTADKLGTAEERKRTKAVIRDLRVLTHATQLLFVRNNDVGNMLIDTWNVECVDGADKQLAFLRALYTVKPRLCVLPTAWLNEVEYQQKQDIMQRGRPQQDGRPLVRVEIEPGRFVKVHKGDE